MSKPLLIVDDNQGIFESLEINFQREGRSCLWAANREQAVRIAGETDIYAAVVDLSLGPENGLDAMTDILRVRPGLPVVFISGFGTLEAAVRAVKLGAYDFLPKPLNFRKLRQVIEEAVAAKNPGRPVAAEARTSGIVAVDDGCIARVMDQAARISGSDVPVLVTGESGVGKELFAEFLHKNSPRRDGPFVRINCSAITDGLAESELFGHVKGAFTGAVSDHRGFFEQADGGTVHLDEIGDMSPATQARVLRVLEDSKIRRVGGSNELPVSVRIVASTNKDLADMSRTNRFRLDLYYRLNTIELTIPPLREHLEDLPLLLEHFLGESGDGTKKRFSPEAIEIMRAYPWPGNIREFRNVVRACVLLNPGDVIDCEQLPQNLRKKTVQTSGQLRDMEREAIFKELTAAAGDKKLAAKRLGISLRTLYNKLDRYDGK